MSVVINEFEVMSETPPASQGSPDLQNRETAEPPSALEIERIVSFLDDRSLRIWAH